MTTSAQGPESRSRDHHPMDELFLLRTHLARLVVERGRDASPADDETYLALGEREMQLLMAARCRRAVRGRVGGGTTSAG